MTDNQFVALTYSRCGVRIFPCREENSGSGNAKAPYVKGGFHSASADEAQIQSWWKIWPNAAIGLPCRMNRIVAIDADRHGHGDGVAALVELFTQQGFDPNSIPCISTPRDGRHYIFRRSPGLGDMKAKVAAAIDVRDNAYVVAAGSIMASHLYYSLCNGSLDQFAVAIGNGTLPSMPDWLATMIAKPVTPVTAPIGTAPLNDNDGYNVSQRLAGLIRKVVLAPSGNRNAMLHWASCRAGELVALNLVNGDVAEALMIEAGRQAGLSKHEVYATVKSGLRVASGAL